MKMIAKKRKKDRKTTLFPSSLFRWDPLRRRWGRSSRCRGCGTGRRLCCPRRGRPRPKLRKRIESLSRRSVTSVSGFEEFYIETFVMGADAQVRGIGARLDEQGFDPEVKELMREFLAQVATFMINRQ